MGESVCLIASSSLWRFLAKVQHPSQVLALSVFNKFINESWNLPRRWFNIKEKPSPSSSPGKSGSRNLPFKTCPVSPERAPSVMFTSACWEEWADWSLYSKTNFNLPRTLLYHMFVIPSIPSTKQGFDRFDCECKGGPLGRPRNDACLHWCSKASFIAIML